jgi:hypothetical protein
MSVNPRVNPDTNIKTKYLKEHTSTVHDMQVLLMDLQSLSSATATEIEDDKIIDKFMISALYLKSINRELRIKCLYMAYLFVRPTLNVKSILREWPEMARLIREVYPTLNSNKTKPTFLKCLMCIEEIVSFMMRYTSDNTGYNPNSSIPNNNHQHNTNWHHQYSPYVPPPRGGKPREIVFASSISTQEDR